MSAEFNRAGMASLLRLLDWMDAHSVQVLDSGMVWVKVTSACVQDNGGILCPCSSVPVVLRSVSEAREWMGY